MSPAPEEKESKISQATPITLGAVAGVIVTLVGATAFLNSQIADGDRRVLDRVNKSHEDLVLLRLSVQRVEGQLETNWKLNDQRMKILEAENERLRNSVEALRRGVIGDDK